MPVEDFLSIFNEDIIYKVLRDNQVIEQLIETFKHINLTYNNSEKDN
ncbi:23262_t:CDS:1, partial [Cetraspora pellucida]